MKEKSKSEGVYICRNTYRQLITYAEEVYRWYVPRYLGEPGMVSNQLSRVWQCLRLSR